METTAADGLGSKYVQMTREEIEGWLDDIGFRGKWKLVEGRAGIYTLTLSPYVGIKFSSTVSSQEQVVGYAGASMQLALVSLVTGQVVNKKAQGQDHFKRTLNWRKTWKEGIDRMKDAYLKAADFYDNIAQVEDRGKYRQEKLTLIEQDPNWKSNSFLMDLHAKVDHGGILSPKQLAAIEKIISGRQDAQEEEKQEKTQVTRQPVENPQDADDPKTHQSETTTKVTREQAETDYLAPLRQLWKAAKTKNDTWTQEFVESLAELVKRGRPPTPKQIEVILKKFQAYRINPGPWTP